MEWTRSHTLALAQERCIFCLGLGLREGRSERTTVCNCVLRAIFRICYQRFQACALKEKFLSRVSLEANPGRHRKHVWGLKNEEYMADFCSIARRALAGDELAMDVFRFHILLGAPWSACCRKLGWPETKESRGAFYHEVYRVEQALGRAFAETEPYALFPVDAYFASSPHEKRTSEPERRLAIESGREPWIGPQDKKARHFPRKARGAA